MRTALVPVALGAAVVFLAAPSRAAAVWGDASMQRDDVRIDLDENGRATVTHTIAVRVTGKRFRTFVIDGTDEAVAPPNDEATLAGLDGPGWPAAATDAKGQAIDAFVEPTKEPRRLRVRLGIDGVPRGEYSVQIRYRVDLSSAFTRDGAMARLTWTAPRWAEGYDSAKIVIALPAAPTEPRVAIADVGGEGEHSLDGFALVAVRRGAQRDEIEITRPHVAAHDDTRFILRADPRALPNVSASAAAIRAQDTATAPIGARRGRTGLLAAASAALVALAALLRLRDRDAERAGPFRPMIALPSSARAAGFGACAAAAIVATWSSFPLLGAAATACAMACATLRAPRPELRARGGRWLAVPEAALPASASRVVGFLDPGGARGRVLALLLGGALAVGLVLAARHDPRAALALAMNAGLLVPLFVTGRAAQLPPDPVRDVWAALRPIAKVLAGARGARCRVVARTTKGIDEVRLRVEPNVRGALRMIEIGCGVVHASGGSTLVPELLVRIDDGSELVARVVAGVAPDDEVTVSLGRSEGERVVALRPSAVTPPALRARVEALLQLAADYAAASPPAAEAA